MICASARLSAAADFPGECIKLIFVDHNHPYLSATVQLLDRRCYLIHKTTLLLTLLFCYLQYFPLAPVLLSTAKQIFLLMILYFIWLEYEACYNPCFILNSGLQHYLQKVPLLWRSLLVLVIFLPPSWEISVAASAPCAAGSYRPGFLFVLSLLITFEFPQYSISRLTHPLFLFSIYFMLPTLSQPPPWDSSTPLPCSDSFWEKWQLEQLQSSLIADAGQCPVPGQWHVEWTPQVPFSSLTCTPRDNYTFISHKENQLMLSLG